MSSTAFRRLNRLLAKLRLKPSSDTRHRWGLRFARPLFSQPRYAGASVPALSSLTNRIFLACALLAVLSIGLAMYFVNVAVSSQAEQELQRGLEEAGGIVEQYRVLQFDHFVRQARLLGDLPKLKAAVETDHPDTVEPIAKGYQQQIQSDLMIVTNPKGRVLAQVGRTDLDPDAIATVPAVQQAGAGRETTSFWPRAGGVVQVVSVPIWIGLEQPEILGTLSVGFNLDRDLATQFKALTRSDIAFAVDGRVRASTLPAAHEARLGSLLNRPGMSRLVLGDQEYVAVTRTFAYSGPRSRAGVSSLGDDASHVPVTIILRSRTERLRFLGALHTALGAIGAVAVLVATLLSYAVARTITRPLGTITAAMRDMAATGDLTRRIALPAGVWDDEDARLLAHTLNTMTESINRFQRDAAQRERLSSLGRLSTVVAHEIRNPLMIIKTSLRTLRRDQAKAEQIRAALNDIDEEVGRLNRLVNEVLDFARPIRFELGAADLNAVCADAADAAMAPGDTDGGPAVRLVPALESARVVTDAERLRLALVNVLTNARQAVRLRLVGAAAEAGRSSHRTGESADTEIELATSALPNDRVAITVRDSGIGIAPEDLPRVFEPFFTTKRAGSGLGLAIAKNIIDGLGGTITMSSRAGEGTEVRIELPR